MSTTESREFAFGSNVIGDCTCPAVAAGYDPMINNPAVRIAARYDAQVEKNDNCLSEGKIPEAVAKEAWFDAIESIEANGADSEVAYEIAEELGWVSE